jgi:hypothetical protein
VESEIQYALGSLFEGVNRRLPGIDSLPGIRNHEEIVRQLTKQDYFSGEKILTLIDEQHIIGFCRKFPGRTCDTRGYDKLYPASE